MQQLVGELMSQAITEKLQPAPRQTGRDFSQVERMTRLYERQLIESLPYIACATPLD